MIESVLVVDDGLGATRVISTSQRLGIKAVLLTTTDRATRSSPADDLVLLSAPELADPAAVVAAAASAEVDAVHPAMGPLRADRTLAERAADARLTSFVTVGTLSGPDVAVQLAAEGVGFSPAAASTCTVLVFGTADGAVVLGDLFIDGPCAEAPARLDEAARDAAHRTARAAVAVLGIAGLAAVDVADRAVVDISGGIRPEYAAWEAVAGADLVEVQLRAAQGEPPLADLGLGETPIPSGVAVSGEVAVDIELPGDPEVRLESYLGPDGEPHARVTVRRDTAEDARTLLRALRPG
ncbi:MAG TPA: biotin carboxylase N-terminal domain-containing protein [Jatrophihabitantaceae bacterium]|nr:biotin carboxylase N-terminal domain-containing protein [Jatrophihabitantaceae bacterium]